jgi:U4/U6 small nuclear ribonucleoprotein PRP3
MSETQHRAIDLSGRASGLKRFLRASEIRRKSSKESENAISSLLNRHLNAVKEKSESSMKSEANHPEAEQTSEVPTMEWWDALIFENPASITNLVEHPVPLKGVKSSASSAVAKAYLTEKERDKLRRLKRKEREEDMQNQIRLGLMRPPPPRIKLKNLSRVLAQQAVAGPSAVEQVARAQAEQRVRDHEQRNLENKLTPEQKRAKNIAKWTKPLDYSDVVKTSVYMIFTEVGGRARFKICKNAQQLHVSGIFVDSKLKRPESNDCYPSLVVVEGSRKAVKRFDRLMLHRIDWTQTETKDGEDVKMEDADGDGSDDDDEEDSSTKRSGNCVRIFHGTEAKGPGKRYVAKWTYAEMKNLDETVGILQEKGYLHYWEMVSRYRSASLDI